MHEAIAVLKRVQALLDDHVHGDNELQDMSVFAEVLVNVEEALAKAGH